MIYKISARGLIAHQHITSDFPTISQNNRYNVVIFFLNIDQKTLSIH